MKEHGVDRAQVIRDAVIQLTAWAKARTRIMYGSGTEMNELIFVAQLVGPDADDAFLVVNPVQDPQNGAPWIGGRISLNRAHHVSVRREDQRILEVALQSRYGHKCTILDPCGSPQDHLLNLRFLSESKN